MAAELADKADIELQPQSESSEDVVTIELPAPQGWTKKLIIEKGGSVARNEIVFTAPTGEEIKNKRQLSQYLKAHPGGPSNSEFDWGTGDTPRRSARLSSKPRATETPESGSSRKRQKKSSSKNEDDKKDEGDGEDVAAEGGQGEIQSSREVEMKDTEDAGETTEHGKDSEAPLATDAVKDSDKKGSEKAENGSTEKPEGMGADDATLSAVKEENPGETKVDEREKQEQHEETKVEEEETRADTQEKREETKVEAEESKADTQVPQETPNAKEKEPVEHEAETAIEQANAQVTQKTPLSTEINSSEEKAVKEVNSMDVNANVGKQQVEAEVGQETPDENACSKESANVSEGAPDHNGVKEKEEVAKNAENEPVSQGPSAPPIRS